MIRFHFVAGASQSGCLTLLRIDRYVHACQVKRARGINHVIIFPFYQGSLAPAERQILVA
jgi:hypothetical protein